MRTRPRWKNLRHHGRGARLCAGVNLAGCSDVFEGAGVSICQSGLSLRRLCVPGESDELSAFLLADSENAMKLVERFKCEEPGEKDLLLFLWAHSYEMDYEKGNASWYALERLFESIAGRNDIVYCTNSEAFAHI